MSAVPASQLDTSAVISEAFDVYKRAATILIPAALIIYALQAVALLALAGSAVGALLITVIGFVLSAIYTGAVVQLVRDARDGTIESTAAELVSAVLPVLGPLIVVSILAGIAIGVGLILLLIPGLFLMTIFAVVAPVTVIEKPGIFAAFGRSQALVKGSGWQVFGVIALVFLLSIAASLIAAIIGAPIGDAGRIVVQWIASALLLPISALAYAATYLSLREVHGEPPLPSGAAVAPGHETPPYEPPSAPGIPGA